MSTRRDFFGILAAPLLRRIGSRPREFAADGFIPSGEYATLPGGCMIPRAIARTIGVATGPIDGDVLIIGSNSYTFTCDEAIRVNEVLIGYHDDHEGTARMDV